TVHVISPWLTLSALRQAECARPLQPTTFPIRYYLDHIDTTFLDAGNPAVVTAQIITDLDPVNASRATNECLHALVVAEHADHLEPLDIETFEELPDPVLVRLDVLRALLPLRQV